MFRIYLPPGEMSRLRDRGVLFIFFVHNKKKMYFHCRKCLFDEGMIERKSKCGFNLPVFWLLKIRYFPEKTRWMFLFGIYWKLKGIFYFKVMEVEAFTKNNLQIIIVSAERYLTSSWVRNIY